MISSEETRTENKELTYKPWHNYIFFLTGLFFLVVVPFLTYGYQYKLSFNTNDLLNSYKSILILLFHDHLYFSFGILSGFFSFGTSLILLPYWIDRYNLNARNLLILFVSLLLAGILNILLAYIETGLFFYEHLFFIVPSIGLLFVGIFTLGTKVTPIKFQESLFYNRLGYSEETVNFVVRFCNKQQNRILADLILVLFLILLAKLYSSGIMILLLIVIPSIVLFIIWLVITLLMIAIAVFVMFVILGIAFAILREQLFGSSDAKDAPMISCPICNKEQKDHSLHFCKNCGSSFCDSNKSGFLNTVCPHCKGSSNIELSKVNPTALLSGQVKDYDHSLEHCPICFLQQKNHDTYQCKKCNTRYCDKISGSSNACPVCNSTDYHSLDRINSTGLFSSKVKEVDKELEPCSICFKRETNHVAYFCDNCSHRFCNSTESGIFFSHCPKCDSQNIKTLKVFNQTEFFSDTLIKENSNLKQCPVCFKREKSHPVYRCNSCSGKFCGTLDDTIVFTHCVHCKSSDIQEIDRLN